MVRDYGFLVATLAAGLVFAVLEPSFLKRDNLIGIVGSVAIIGVMAVCSTFVVITGGIDLSVGPVMALAGLLAAYRLEAGDGLTAAILVGLVAGAAVGLTNGLIVSWLSLPPIVVTLGMLSIVRGIALLYGESALHPIAGPPAFLDIGGARPLGIPFPVLLFLAVGAVAYLAQQRSRFGFTVFAVGENREAARLCGLPLARTETLAYVLSGLGAAAAGIVLASQVHTASATYGGGYELDVIAAIVVGGTSLFGGSGSVHRSILGALTIGMINNGLSILNVDLSKQLIVKGAIIVVALSFDQFLRRDRRTFRLRRPVPS
jgi:ribose/xylose/arabinose/galactoside ABC-type transport system permease subunit